MARQHRRSIAADSRHRLELPRLLEWVAAGASSPPGRAAVLALEPAPDPETVQQRLDETAELEQLLEGGGRLDLGGVEDLHDLLADSGAAASRMLATDELARILRLLERAHAVEQLLATRGDLPLLARRGRALVDLRQLREALGRSIDPQGEVLDGASPELGDLRRRSERQRARIRTWMERHRDSAPFKKALQGNVISVRNGRFVFAVRVEARGLVKGVVHGESGSGATLFIEPQGVLLDGNELDELRLRQRREVARIVAELTRSVRAERAAIRALQDGLVALDVILARTRFGLRVGGCRPRLAEGRELRLVAARHPLLLWREGASGDGRPFDLAGACERVYPLDLALDARHYQMVITGPNTGGKTVVLKTVGLLALMTYCGLPLPAGEGTVIPMFDAVLADIGDEQSLEQNLSTFSSHMKVVGEMLGVAGSRSLVLIDELGAGTDPLEGAALGEALLDALYERGCFALVTTHIGRLKEFAFRRRKCRNASMQFDPERCAPTYRLIDGVPGRSNATLIARRLGLPEDIVDAAERRLGEEQRVDPEVLAGLERVRDDLERQREEAAAHRDAARALERETRGELAEAQALRSAVEHEAEQAEEQRVRALVNGLQAAVRALGDPPRERRAGFQELTRLLDEARRGTPLSERRLALARTLRKGDAVFVPRLRQVCEVKRINKTRERLTVSFNGLATEVSFQEISWILPPPGYQLEWYEA